MMVLMRSFVALRDCMPDIRAISGTLPGTRFCPEQLFCPADPAHSAGCSAFSYPILLKARADRGQNFCVYIARGTIFRVRVVCTISYYRRYFHYVFNSRRCAVVPYWQYCSCQVIHQCIYILIYISMKP